MQDMTRHRRTEANRIMAVLALICAVGCLAALVPTVENTMNGALLALCLGGALGLVVRRVARFVRERREDRADALVAARWRAEHSRQAAR